ncbi:MAG: transposase zinc-binding domain-containing protein [Planctomycetes bacterium]|nr:transposase zinc-binding domain-containing protein [Planctomycetota bacterium]
MEATACVRRQGPIPPAGHSPYRRRRPEETLLYRIVRENLDTFLASSTDPNTGEGLPAYVISELHTFLRCGILAHGFARVRCRQCKDDLVVAFS